uniref:Uncharacterized protein n=1 Tax=Hucho hucho TaxID=62062 RepID=A0A4W5R9X2_9TELE
MFAVNFLWLRACVSDGADLNAIDIRKQKCARETLSRLRRLNLRPRAEQFTESYVPEWPELNVLVAKATANKSASQMITQRIKSTFSFNFPQDPQDGVLDHMVRITTSIHSPLVVTACRPLCPTSPPEVGKRRLAVPELMKKEMQDFGLTQSHTVSAHVHGFASRCSQRGSQGTKTDENLSLTLQRS